MSRNNLPEDNGYVAQLQNILDRVERLERAVSNPPAIPWKTYTPTITAGTGSFTSVNASGRYFQYGKTIFVRMQINIVTNGTAAGGVKATLPIEGLTTLDTVFYGREDAVTGKMLQARYLNTTAILIYNYDNSYPGGTGYKLDISGTYEIP